ncbi:MAG: ATP-binding protein [Planctomycetaceae bacterium]|nr:ATP-binding protein [Planctomycetaceae bacterium]
MLPSEIETLKRENAELREKLNSMHAQLMQAQKLGSIGVLASSITHEFNNILMTIINYSKMGLRHRDNDTREKAFNKILDAGQRASKITTGMLAYARAKGDRRDPLSLVQVVQDVITLVEKDLQKHRITLETRFQDEPYAEINSGQVQQVLMNLIINARQAMDKGGTMTIIVRSNAEDGMGEIAVRDTGSGIPAEKLAHIFDPFFTTKSADAHGQGGTGLGLALCKDVIEGHKGRIRVESAEGVGTCFTLRFPLVEEPALLAG